MDYQDLINNFISTPISIELEDCLWNFQYEAEFTNDVIKKNYRSVIQKLSDTSKETTTNKLYYEIIYNLEGMTGIEWAFYKSDWKMAVIFFIFGADPNNNGFNGTINTMGSELGVEPPRIHPGFDGENTIPGFNGLELLIEEDNHKGKAYIMLMRVLSGDTETIPIHKNFTQFTNAVDLVSENLQFTGNDSRTFLLDSIKCMTQYYGLPNELALRIAEESLLAKIWSALEEFCLRESEEVNSNDEGDT